MNYFLSFLLVLLLQGCQQALPVEPAPPTSKELVAAYTADLQQTLQTIKIGETTTDLLTNFTKLNDEQYERPPYVLHIENGLVNTITLSVPGTLTVEDVAEVNMPWKGFDAKWLSAEDRITGLQLTRTTPTLQQQIADMPLDEKVGQLVLTGFDGTTVTPIVKQAIEEAHIGHVILFSKNITTPVQLQALNQSLLQLNSTQPLWITVDEEGGKVSRIPDSLTVLPTAARLAKNYSTEQVKQLAASQGELLRALGFAVNFAPVLDVNSNPKNPVIGNRAFSANVKTVNSYTTAFTTGLENAGVLAVGKHFPGHGDTATDSHVGLPVIHKSKEQLQKTELAPFQHAIDHGIQMLMIGHLLVPALDTDTPASYSRAVMHELLRKEMGFSGVIITDDLTMQAVNMPIADAAVKAIVAGADIALIGHGTEQAIAATKALETAVASGQLTEQELNARVYRILSLKERYSGHVDDAFDFASWNKKIRTQLNNN
ncbi:MAG: beta-N-acetylhexosaminidase [Solibacillus sp.]